MEVWMKHEEHGVMKVHERKHLELNKRDGWKEMTKAEVEQYRFPHGKPEPESQEPETQSPGTDESVSEEDIDLADLKKADLVTLAEENGLDPSGTKADLIERLSGVV